MVLNSPDFSAPSTNRVEYRFSLPTAAAPGEFNGASGATVEHSPGEATGLVGVTLPPISEIDWSNAIQQKKFAALERKVGRGNTADDEVEEYLKQRKSRRAWVQAKTYLHDYLEEEREKAVLRKLGELQQLLARPIRM